MRPLVAVAALISALVVALPALGGEALIHRVARGQTLGKIARRYNVTIEALCAANGIDQRAKIRPGKKLWVPPRDDPDGSRTRKEHPDDEPAAVAPPSPPKESDRPAPIRATPSPGAMSAQRWHRVVKGQRLGSIARRYGVTSQALCHANDIPRCRLIKAGQRLIVPAVGDVDGAHARAERLASDGAGTDPRADPKREPKGKDRGAASAGKTSSWSHYTAKTPRKGFITVIGRKGRRYAGQALTASGNVRGAAKRALSKVLATSDGQTIAIDPRLIQLLARVSDTFGGRPIRVVSGFRLADTPRGSRHRTGHAIDFTIQGVPNTALRDYVKTFERVGVGYYPNSHFVHLDTRETWTTWIDYSGPGQRPRYGGLSTRRAEP
jgi:uncharacterized protein YcbK (DUF882 family)